METAAVQDLPTADRAEVAQDARLETPLPPVEEARRVAPRDARRLSKMFFDRLALLEEGTAEYQYARNTLIEMNLSLVRYAASRFRSRGQEMEDIVQVGTIGLIKAIDRFDIALENEFTTFAVPYIVGEIKRFFRDTTWSVHVPRRLQELRVDLARAREDLEGQGIHDPSVAELAEHLDLGQEEVIEGLVACNGYSADSIDRPIESRRRWQAADRTCRRPDGQGRPRARPCRGRSGAQAAHRKARRPCQDPASAAVRSGNDTVRDR